MICWYTVHHSGSMHKASQTLAEDIIQHIISNYSIFSQSNVQESNRRSQILVVDFGDGWSSCEWFGGDSPGGRWWFCWGGVDMSGRERGSGGLLSLSKALWVALPPLTCDAPVQPWEGSPNHITSERERERGGFLIFFEKGAKKTFEINAKAVWSFVIENMSSGFTFLASMLRTCASVIQRR